MWWCEGWKGFPDTGYLEGKYWEQRAGGVRSAAHSGQTSDGPGTADHLISQCDALCGPVANSYSLNTQEIPAGRALGDSLE